MLFNLSFIPFHVIPPLSAFCLSFIPATSLEFVLIRYIFHLSYLGILKSMILLSLLSSLFLLSCKKKKKKKKEICKGFEKSTCHFNLKFWTVINTTNKALVIIWWYSEGINGYDKILIHVKLHLLALKIR